MHDGKSRHPAALSDQDTYQIKFISGPHEGQTYPLQGERITLGRKNDNTIVLPDPNVSGVHAEIVFENGVPVIRDLGSTNGVLMDGNKVDEVILSEGDCVTLGNSRFELHTSGAQESGPQPATPSPEKDAGMDDVRVIRDIRPGRRGLGGLVLLMVLLVALAASAYYYFFQTRGGATTSALTPNEGNLAGAGWSFEPPAKGPGSRDLWDLEGPAPEHFARVHAKPYSGLCSLKADLDSGGFALARRNQRLAANSRRSYTARLRAALQGEVAVVLKAVFYAAPVRGEAAGTAAACLSTDDIALSRNDDGAYHLLEGLISPPVGAAEMELEIVAAGRGIVHVDDLEIFEDASPAVAQSLVADQLELVLKNCGFEILRQRNKRFLLHLGRIEILRQAGEGQTNLIGSEAGGSYQGRGVQFAGSDVGLLEVAQSVERTATGFAVSLSSTGTFSSKGIEILYCFDLDPEYAATGVGLFQADDYLTMAQAFPRTAAKALLFGGQHDRIRIAFENQIEVSAVEQKSGGLTLRYHLTPSPGIERRIEIKTDFTEDNEEAQDLITDADKAALQRHFGQALTLIGKIEVSFPFIESVLNPALAIKSRILAEKKELLDVIGERLASALRLENPELYNDLEAYCRRCLDLFPGDMDFTTSLEQVREQSRELRQEIEAEKAERLYNIARNLHSTGKRDRTLTVVLEALKEKYPDSEWTRKALELDQQANGQDRNRN